MRKIKASKLRSPIAQLQGELRHITREQLFAWVNEAPENAEPATDLEELHDEEAQLREAVQNKMPDKHVLELALSVLEHAPKSIIARRLLTRYTALQQQFQLRWVTKSYREALNVVGRDFCDAYAGRFGDHPFGLELLFFLADVAMEARGDADLTLAAGERLLGLDVRDPLDFGAFLVGCYLQLERLEDARKLVERVTPENTPDRWSLLAALVMKRSGDEEKAQAHLESAFKVTPYLKTLLADASLQNFPDGTEPPAGWDDAMNLLDTIIEPFMTDDERAWLMSPAR